MKTIKIAFATAALFFGMSTANAQTKFGHIDVNELLAAMPEVKTVEKQLQDFQSALQKQMEVLSTEYQGKLTDFQSKEKTMTDAIKGDKIKEIQDLEGRMSAFQQKAQQDITNKNAEVMNPILAKAEKAIKDVAADEKIGYVFDSSKGVLIQFPEGDNILNSVKKKLGI